MLADKSVRTCLHEAGDFIRVGEERKDPSLIEALRLSPAALFVPVWRELVLVRQEAAPCPVFLPRSQLAGIAEEESALLLGFWRGDPVFVLDLAASDDAAARLAPLGVFQELRRLFPLITGDELRLLGYAKSILHWQRTHRFCGVCGSPTLSAEAGHVRLCSNPACATPHYPRTDPAVIVLVTRGEEGLFVRQSIWPERMYALVSGFVEPGETLEETAAREALEETALIVEDIRYFGSKPWPFPGTLMLAFTAEAAGGELRLADGELEDGRFLSRSALKEAVLTGDIRLPSRHSMAYPLIESWYDAGDEGLLAGIDPSQGQSALTPG